MTSSDGGPDRHHAAAGQAALMLVESLMLSLVERRVIDPGELIEAVETVIETKRRLAADGREPAIAREAVALLTTIANSLAATGLAAKE